MVPVFPRNKPINIACEHAMSEGSSGALWSMEEGFCLSLRWGVV